MKFRHEIKYYINEQSYAVLSSRVSAALHRDENGDEFGEYMIRSLYFDDREDSALMTKVAGDKDREKFRIRIYNMQDLVIKLERKLKDGPYISKQSCSITRREFERLVYGDASFLLRKQTPPSGAAYVAMRHRSLRPVRVVDYWREAYTWPVEDVRITFDKDLRMGMDDYDIFNRHMLTVPMLERGQLILEIKFNRYLPGFIQRLLQGMPSEQCAISKYAICRKYE